MEPKKKYDLIKLSINPYDSNGQKTDRLNVRARLFKNKKKERGDNRPEFNNFEGEKYNSGGMWYATGPNYEAVDVSLDINLNDLINYLKANNLV